MGVNGKVWEICVESNDKLNNQNDAQNIQSEWNDMKWHGKHLYSVCLNLVEVSGEKEGGTGELTFGGKRV